MPEGAGVGVGAGGGGAEGPGAREGVGGVEARAEEDEPSDPRARALWVPRNMIMGSSRFQQFFFMYAKLIAGLMQIMQLI